MQRPWGGKEQGRLQGSREKQCDWSIVSDGESLHGSDWRRDWGQMVGCLNGTCGCLDSSWQQETPEAGDSWDQIALSWQLQAAAWSWRGAGGEAGSPKGKQVQWLVEKW